MYIHLGNGVIVNSSDVIAIMDLESTSMSANTREFLKIVEEEGFVRSVSDEIPKTFIVCEIDGQSVVYMSASLSTDNSSSSNVNKSISNQELYRHAPLWAGQKNISKG